MTANLAKLLKDERVPSVAAIVRTPKDGSDHWAVIAGGLLIHCVTKGHQSPIWAHMSGATRLGRGQWRIPDVGTEVLIAFDNGEFEGDGFLIGTFGRLTGSLEENTTLLLDDNIEARSVGGTAELLALKEDLQTLKNAIKNAVVVANDGGASLKTTILTALTLWPKGTKKFKAE